MSTLMFWNKQNSINQNNDTKNGKRNWLHAPDALLNGHVVYLVKFFGNTPVEQAKGIEVVKDAIRRLQFAQQMKKAETGNNSKTKKVEITVSVDGVAIQEPRTQKILYQFPLHNISYCADEKGVKKFFSFIAKNVQPSLQNDTTTTTTTASTVNSNISTNNNTTTAQLNSTTTTNGHTEEGHECFVFISSKLASDITLTIGQAFDLAYRRYMNDNGKTTELSKVQAQNKQMEKTISAYKQRLKELSELISKSDLERMLSRLGIRDLYEVPHDNDSIENQMNGNKTSETENEDKLLIDTSNSKTFAPIIPPRNLQNQINNTLEVFKPGSGGGGNQKLEELLLNSDSDSDFDPRADENDNGNKISNDLFGFEPPKTFGQQLFTVNNNNKLNNNSNYNNSNNLTNGTNGVAPINPPPLLAPPPKVIVPRRNIYSTNGTMNNNNTESQDLFGSTPFSPNTSSIFDRQTGPNTYNTANNFNDNNIIPSNKSTFMTNSSSISNNIPTLELNVSAFDDNDNDIRNPFSDYKNESGVYDMNNDSLLSENTVNPISNVLPDINTLANNLTKLDGIFNSTFNSQLEYEKSNTVISNEKMNSLGFTNLVRNTFVSDNSQHDQQHQHQQQQQQQLKAKEFFISNPFTKKAENLLYPRNTSNYDVLRNSPEIEAMLQQQQQHQQKQQPQQQQNINNINNNDNNKKDNRNQVTPNYDLFREAASAAFSEFHDANINNNSSSTNNYRSIYGSPYTTFTNTSSATTTKHASNNEFSNKMAGLFATNAQNNSNFESNREQNNFNNSKNILVDDFSLESLDPLRK